MGHLLGILLLGSLLSPDSFAALASAQDAWAHVAFGYVNDDGEFTLNGDDRGANFDPADVTAFVRDGAVFPVTVKTSDEDATKTLAVKGATGTSGLAVPAIIPEKFSLLPLRKLASPVCSAKLMSRLKAAGHRKVVRCQATHSFADGGETGYVVFEKAATGLAGFFVATKGSLAWEPLETTPGHGWREGDNGTFPADDLNFLWALKRKRDGAYGLAYTWGLGEGTHTAVTVARQASLERVFSHYQFNSAGGL